jgi:hypothetical protein
MHIHIYVYTCIYIYIYIYICMHVYLEIHICRYLRIHVCQCIYMNTFKACIFQPAIPACNDVDDDDDVNLEHYIGKGFHINYCRHVLRKTHKLVQ